MAETSRRTSRNKSRRSRRKKNYNDSDSEESVTTYSYNATDFDRDMATKQIFLAKRRIAEEGGSKKRKKTRNKRGARILENVNPEVAEMMRNMKVPLQLVVKHGVRLGVEMRKAVQEEYKAR